MGTRAVSDERKGVGVSGRARLALGVVVVAIAAFLSWSVGMPSGRGSLVATRTPKPNSRVLADWYAESLPHWTSEPFAELADLPRLTQTVAALVRERFPGPEIDESSLVRDLATFLHALGSDGPAEYLARIARLRRPIADVQGDRDLHTFYRLFTGGPLPAKINAGDLLELFWVGDSDAVSHPRKFASVGEVQVAWSKPVPSYPGDGRVRLSAQVFPDFSMLQSSKTDPWVSPVWQSMPRATRATTEFSELIEEHKRVLMCEAFLALQTGDGEVVPVGVILFFSPDEKVWQVENFGNNYTSNLYWPY